MYSYPRGRTRRAFTLVELVLSITVLTVLMLMFAQMTASGTRIWRDGIARTDSYQTGRSALELLSRELAPAVVDTRMQFVLAPGSIFRPEWETNVAPDSPVLLWMAPLGEDGRLRCVGYYLSRQPEKKAYRLKRIYIAPPALPEEPSFFPRVANLQNPRDATLRTSPTDATWFTRQWTAEAFADSNPQNSIAVTATVAEGVIAFWVQCYDRLGQPIPLLSKAANHPASKLLYNSAAFFQEATSVPFENGATFQYLAQSPQSMKANRVPASVELAVVIIDERLLLQNGLTVPEQTSIHDARGALDLPATLQQYEEDLRRAGIVTARTFTTRATLANGN